MVHRHAFASLLWTGAESRSAHHNSPAVQYDNIETSWMHLLGELNALDTNTTTATWEDYPVAGFKTGLDQATMHRRCGAHDWSCDRIVYAVGNARGVDCRLDEVLLVSAGAHEAGVVGFRAVVLA